MKKIFFILFIVIVNLANAQVLTHDVLTTSGGSYTQINGTMSFTIGEIAIETASATNNKLTQGFQQGHYIILSISEEKINPSVSIYPNPTSNSLKVEFAESINSVKLYDMTGNLIIDKKLNATSETFDLSSFATGVYIMHVYDAKNKMYAYKIQKI